MFIYGAVELYDMGFGAWLVPVTPPDCEISQSSSLQPKHRGKAPGVLTPFGWTSLDVNNPRFRCHDYETAKLWMEDWGANIGFAVGDGYVVIDNDQGAQFSEVIQRLLPGAPRRFVLEPKHTRDAFLVRVLDFVGDGADVPNREMVFRQGVKTAKLSVLARGKQAVISGVHPGTRSYYCWDREITDISDIPVLSEEQFQDFLNALVRDLNVLNWTANSSPPTPVSAVPAVSAGSQVSQVQPATNSGNPRYLGFIEARRLLALFPNREVPVGETPNPIDNWLDDYANWVSVAYALIAFLGARANTAEAESIWLEWSDGRTQVRQTSLSVWRSALRQPLQAGATRLLELVRERVREPPDFPDDDIVAEALTNPVWRGLQARWAFCAVKGFVDMKLRYVISRQAFADKHAALAWDLKYECAYPGKGLKPPNVADIFLAQSDRTEIRDITYAPGDPVLIDSDDADMPVFNLWRDAGAWAQMFPPTPATAIALWLEHLEFVLGSREERDRFIRWCVFVIKHPDKKPNWHYLVMSVQGLGKDTMTKPIKFALGKENWCEELIYSLASNFTYVVEHKLLIVGETAQPRAGFINAHDVSTKLKPLTAAPPDRLPINKKNMHPYWIPNRLAVILFSNEENPLALERGQRRIHVVNRRAQKTQTHEYYVKLNEWLDGGGTELVASYLLNQTLTKAEQDEFIGGTAPDTDDKAELEQLNVQPQLRALEELIEDARDGIDSGTPARLVANVEELNQMIRDRGLHPPTPNQTSAWLLDMERANRGVRRARIDPKKPNRCGVVTASGYSGRLWLLADTTIDGRDWNNLTTTEVIALWKNLPQPGNATVLPYRSRPTTSRSAFPDDLSEIGEEPV